MDAALMKYTIILEKAPNNYSAYVPDLPGCVAAGDTREETIRLIQEAVQEHIALLQELGDPVPEPTSEAHTVEAHAAD
jgi:predicted RNase H-like HicB family nuclease